MECRGEQGGVLKESSLGPRALTTLGWGGGGGLLGVGLVGLMPGIDGSLDMNLRVGGWNLLQGRLVGKFHCLALCQTTAGFSGDPY